MRDSTITDSPWGAVTPDGTLGAIRNGHRVVVLELAGGTAIVEIDLDATADGADIAWIGTPPQLFVLSRFGSPTERTTRAQLLDPHERTSIELPLGGAMRILAAVGASVLIAGDSRGEPDALVVTASEARLATYPLRARAQPTAAGATATQLLLALPAAIEEWDPLSRMARRRFRLPRPAVITALGGSDRVLWMTTQQDPARLDIVVLVNRGQPRAHDLPEPIAAVSGHPRSDLVVCVGARTGQLYVVDLDGRTPLRSVRVTELDRVDHVALVVGRRSGALAVRAGHPGVLVSLDSRDAEAPDGREPSRDGTVTLAAASLGDRLAIRHRDAERSEHQSEHSDQRSEQRSEQPESAMRAQPEQPRTWRAEVASWTRAVIAHEVTPAPSVPLIELLARRFAVDEELIPAVVLLYGARLLGHDGVAPIDVARVLDHLRDRRWPEALGRGTLAAQRLVVHARSRVTLAEPAQRMLDELAGEFITADLTSADPAERRKRGE